MTDIKIPLQKRTITIKSKLVAINKIISFKMIRTWEG